MALSAAPKGLSPVGTVTGAAYNEQGRLYYIANDASNTYAIGDIVVDSYSSVDSYYLSLAYFDYHLINFPKTLL